MVSLLESSRGRGTRAAGWFADFSEDQGDALMRTYTLEEGISGWAHAGDEYVEFIHDYQEATWKK